MQEVAQGRRAAPPWTRPENPVSVVVEYVDRTGRTRQKRVDLSRCGGLVWDQEACVGFSAQNQPGSQPIPYEDQEEGGGESTGQDSGDPCWWDPIEMRWKCTATF